LKRYAAVIHLRTPPAALGYNHQNVLRVESVDEALRIDARIADAWSRHPRVVVVDNAASFLEKAGRAIEVIRSEVPACCRSSSDIEHSA
jgi:hypothetical protein